MRKIAVRVATAVTAVAAAAVPLVLGSAPASALSVTPTGTLSISAKGNGHGHGMSQYGAQGAAQQGLSYKQILNFYYPGTTLTTLAPSKIRVLLGYTGDTVQVKAEKHLSLTNYGELDPSGVAYWRLTTDGDNLILQKQNSGSNNWTTVKRGLPDRSAFTRGDFHTVRLHFIDGTEGRYFGQLRGVVSGSGVETVNVVRLDLYVRGVVPYEMSRSWEPAALAAQAVAARSYGRYAVNNPRSRDYDICDNSNCQVYNGFRQYSPSGELQMTDDPAVVVGNNRQVLTYGGHTIFAEFSSSDGGWTADGGHPYLVAKPDPYDAAGGGDPYTLQSSTVRVSQLASYFGLKKVTGISITQRDGHGSWGGRVLNGFVKGVDYNGAAKSVDFDGYDLQWALGLGTTWINVANS